METPPPQWATQLAELTERLDYAYPPLTGRKHSLIGKKNKIVAPAEA